MQWIVMLFPAFMACGIQKVLEKKEQKVMDVILTWGIYTFLGNLIGLMVYQYILRTPNSMNANFMDNSFLIHYAVMEFVLAIVFPFMKQVLNPRISVRVIEKAKCEDKADEEAE